MRADLATALADLDRLARDHPDLAEPAHLSSRILAAAFGARRPVIPARLPADASHRIAEIEQGWADHAPAFRTITLAFDHDDLARRFLDVCEARSLDKPEAKILVRDMRRGRVDLANLLLPGLREDPSLPRASLRIDALLSVIALPTLAPTRRQLEALGAVPPAPYHGGMCPFCGEPARLAEARGIEQHRLLRCSRCAAAWHTPRLACPFCQSANPRHLQIHFLESQPDRARLLTCHACDGKLKIITTLAPLSPPGLIAADLATIHLDLAFESRNP
jgi:hypothetical protein